MSQVFANFLKKYSTKLKESILNTRVSKNKKKEEKKGIKASIK